MKVACYYGCHAPSPRDLCPFDDEEDPQSMEGIVALAGAEPVELIKNECCGASHQVVVARKARPLISRIFENAAANGAEAIATACPLCMLNLDMREAEVNKQRAAQGLEPSISPCITSPSFSRRASAARSTRSA